MDDKLVMPDDPLVSFHPEHMDDVAPVVAGNDKVNVFRSVLVQLVQDGHERRERAGNGGHVSEGQVS